MLSCAGACCAMVVFFTNITGTVPAQSINVCGLFIHISNKIIIIYILKHFMRMCKNIKDECVVACHTATYA